MSESKRAFSGIQPTGVPHIGNFLGAIRHWVQEQESGHKHIYCVVNQHAITVSYDPAELRNNVRDLVAVLLACGLDPSKVVLFVQSHIPEHTELAWLLTCTTPIGWLQRMTQFKEKSEGQRERISAGLLTYPTLMAADILLYQAHIVPVGDDQKQHVELARDLAQRFNNLYGEVFVVPEPVIRAVGARVMGLDDPGKKMSKSEEGQYHAIELLDEPAAIRKKIGRAVTDSQRDIVFDKERAGLFNLLTIYQSLTGESEEAITAHFEGKGYGDLKKEVAEVVIAAFDPIRTRYAEITADPGYIDGVLTSGVERVRPTVDETMSRVRRAMGLQ